MHGRRRPYEPPKLVCYGTLADLTAAQFVPTTFTDVLTIL
jgi:hypothetical protein